MTTLDTTILNVGLPSLQRELHAASGSLQWTVDSYILVRAGSLFSCGALSDRYGRRRCFALGLALFTGSSLSCSLATATGELILFRAVQGLGSALMTPASLAILTSTLTGREERARGIGLWTATTGLSMAAGPVLGGLLVETLGWRSVFWVNVPIGIAALAGTRRLRESKAAVRRGLDVPGQVTLAAGLCMFTYALIAGPEESWRSAPIVLLTSASLVSLALFVIWELRTDHPLIEIRVLRSRLMAGSVAIVFAGFLALGAFLFFNTLYLQDVRGYSALAAGLITVPTTITIVVIAPRAARRVSSHGPRLPATIAPALLCASMLFLAMKVTTHTPVWMLLTGYIMLGSGIGMVNPPATYSAVASMPEEQTSVAAAVTSTSRQIGSNLGVALVGAVVFSAGTRVIGNLLALDRSS